MTIRISLGTVLAALVFIAIGAGTAVSVMLWEPWDGDREGGRMVGEPSPIADTSSLQIVDVLVPAGAALIGALVGALAPYTVARRQWTREDSLRFLDHKRRAYASVTGHSFDLTQTTTAESRKQLTSDLWRAVAEVRLLSSPGVGELARALASTSYQLALEDGSEKRTQRPTRFKKALDNFEQSAREDLHVSP